MKQVKISSNRLSIIFFILSAIALVLFAAEIGEANSCIRNQAQIEENRRICERESQALSDASDYLTSEVWHFVATQRKEHLANYWNEVNHTKRRENALRSLEALSLTDGEREKVERAKQESDELIRGEAWAMRLTADSIGLNAWEMPPEVAAVTYTNGEDKLTLSEKKKLASDYIFGEDYAEVKDSIKGNLYSFRRLLQDRKNAELKEAMRQTQVSLNIIKILMAVLILFFVILIFVEYFLVMRPFHSYELNLGKMEGKGFSALVPMGAKETRAFAAAFNEIFSEWVEQKNRLEQERYRFHVALENTSVIIFEYEIATDVYTAYGTLEDKRNGQQLERVIPRFLSEYAGGIMGEDGVEQLGRIIDGTQYGAIEMQIKSPAGDEGRLWVKITGTPVYDENGNIIKLIGKISNIQSEKEKEFALENARNRDGLTGFYKRKSGMRIIREYMQNKKPEEICCMMILDMDDFGRVNEEDGHVFADAVLQDVADILQQNMGPEDIPVRLGGDEFLLFFKNFTKADAAVTGERIAAQIGRLSCREDKSCGVSASIGMCTTEAVDNYDGLYHCAESTLKYVKEHEKGKAACYLDTSKELDIPLTQLYPEGYLFNKIDRSDNIREDLPSFALDLLGKSKNLNDAVYLLLARVGNICHFDRITIMETDMEYLSCHVIHQWTASPSGWIPAEVQYAEGEEMTALSKSYDGEGLCDRYVISSPYEMGSILHAAIWNYGVYAGCMSFETIQEHQWTKKERSLLSELTRIISSFILKAKADAVSQAKTDFLSRMSHEIRTPMNAITGMTTIAKTVLDDPEKELDCLNKIEFANRHLMNLINDILDMSRIESGKIEISAVSTNLSRLAENVEMLVKPQAEAKGLELVIENRYTKGRGVMVDELHLNQVLVNLLSNAVKFTEEGGRVTFRIEPVSEEEDAVLVRFSVKDTGIGINSEAQKRIFNAFEQAGSDTAANYGGTGLGLSISSRLVLLMGGTLEVKSAPDRGSCFFFTLRLPCSSEEEILTDGGKKREILFDPHGKRLLLAEDNELNLEIAQEILSGHGFLVETASDGREAVEQFGGHEAGYYDAVLMDIRMPVMDGMEATRRIRTMGRKDSRTIPIIAMTANAFDEDMKKSLENGMNGHLSKPIEVEKLFKMLAELIFAREND